MANEHWYVLKVRPGFAHVVVQKLRELNLETVLLDELVPDQTSFNAQQPDSNQPGHPSAGYVYCRFTLENYQTVTSVPGVLAILGTPVPTPVDCGLGGFQIKRPS
jgi:hypothetical protein